MGGELDFHLVAAALRTDRADVESYHRVLSDTLGSALPPGMVEVERKRSLADRMNGREGTPVALTVTTPDSVLVLRPGRAEVRQIVRGVTIKRSTVGIDEWLVALAGVLSKLAGNSAAAREALTNLLG